MSSNGKVIMMVLSLIYVQASLCMDQAVPEKQPDTILVSEKSASEVAATSSFSLGVAMSTLPTFSDVANYFSSGLVSLQNTVTNQVSDEAAFRKLGWPLSDSVAQTELQLTGERYKLILTTS